jgi:hypothetical protein
MSQGVRMNLLDLASAALAQFEGRPTAPTAEADHGTKPHRGWLLRFGDRDPLEVILSDPLTHGEVLALYPAAVTAIPVQAPHRTATPAERDELRALAAAILPGDREAQAEALDIALADVDAALTCYRALAADREHQGPAANPTGDPLPVLPTCQQCRNLTAGGLCRAATRRYSPTPDIGRRCTDFAPKPDDPDQRTGAERWPRPNDQATKGKS